jgi:branched-chain amino acid transport system substrate-binding protein
MALPTIMDLAEKSTGKKPTTTGVLQDNTAAPVSFMKPMRAGGFEKAGLKIAVDEIYTPPLSDATPLVAKVRTARPDFLWLISTNIPDDSLLLQKLTEMGIGADKLPVVGNGAHFGAPELLKVAGADVLEGLLVTVANWSNDGQRDLIERFKKRTGEPWLTQDSLCAYGHIWILKEAVEKAGVADKRKVAEAIRAMDTSEGSAKFFAGNHIKFDDKGRRVDAPLVIFQWQKGVPVTVYPQGPGTVKAKWAMK